MQQEKYRKLVQEQIKICKDILVIKNAEYATEDALHNFRQAAHLQGQTMRQALGGFMAKHTVSLYDMIQSPGEYTDEIWTEKITDHINYLLILKAVIADEKSEKE